MYGFFNKTKTLQHLKSSKKFVDTVLKKKGKVILLVNQNADLAAEIKENVMKYFS